MSKNLKTAPQILEHYTAISNWVLWWSKYTAILKAMRHYNRIKIERIKDKLREEVKDEMYEEARRNVLEQYNLN